MKNLAGIVSHLLIAGMLVMSGCGGKGDPGATGTPGDKGANGNNGANGDAGPEGKQGTTGTNGATGTNGTNGATGDAGLSTALLSLTITDSLTNAAVSGATVTLAPTGTITIDPTKGTGSATLAIGDYTLTIKATGYTTATQDVELVAGVADPLTIKLVPTANVIVAATSSVTTAQAPGTQVTLTGTETTLDGSTGATYSWTQTAGATATITGANTATPTVTLPSAAAIQSQLITALTSSGDPTPTVRLDVVGINPYSITQATTVTFQVQVTTSSGSYKNTVSVTATAPFQVTSGLRNVPILIPQLLQGDPGVTWAWTVTSAPSGSTAAITNPGTQYPVFTPDVAGTYVLSEASGSGSLKLYAGTWSPGALDKTNVDPTTDTPTGVAPAASCGQCHDGVGNDPPNVWAEWSKTGHAVIVPENIDAAGSSWSVTSCGSCHTVGWNTTAVNGGADEAYAAIIAESGNSNWKVPSGAPGSFYSMLNSSDPNVVKLADQMNVQCENCHGPNVSAGHKTSETGVSTTDALARVNLKAEVCGACHGEPLHHGRYQEWQESDHANLTVAVGRAVDASTAIPAYPASDTTNCNAACQAILEQYDQQWKQLRTLPYG